MPIGSVSSVADNLISALLQRSLQTAVTTSGAGSSFEEARSAPASQLSGRDLVNLLTTARTTLLGLAAAATRLDVGSPTSAFFAVLVTSSDASKVSAQALAGTDTTSTPARATYSLTVSQLAVAQSNVGTALTSASANGFTAGTNTLRITQNGTSTDVSFSVAAGESNETVLRRYSDAVNANSALGVSASVNTDAVAGTSRLVLQSKLQGTTNAFTLSNVAGTPVTDAGVGAATTSPANAAYTLDGATLTSDTNSFFLGDGGHLQISLVATTSTPVQVSIVPNVALVGGAISSLLGSFNASRSFFGANADAYPIVASRLGGIASKLSAQLSAIGITAEPGGSLSVDTTALETALGQAFGTVRAAIGEPRGLAPELRHLADFHASTPSVALDALPAFPATYTPNLLLSVGELQREQLTGLLVSTLV